MPDMIFDDGKSSIALYVRGRNFGRLTDVPLMDAEEQLVDVPQELARLCALDDAVVVGAGQGEDLRHGVSCQ